jgi:hypothetical protein
VRLEVVGPRLDGVAVLDGGRVITPVRGKLIAVHHEALGCRRGMAPAGRAENGERHGDQRELDA